jgi:hypothetical protein
LVSLCGVPILAEEHSCQAAGIDEQSVRRSEIQCRLP